jgi:DNA-binding NtrC family response regulator
MESLPPSEVAGLVLVSPYTADHESLQRILNPLIWRFCGFSTGRDCLDFLQNHDNVAVVICEKSLPDGEWKELMGELESVPVKPSFIVAARLADERLWAEVLNLGAFDLLAAPFEREEVVRVTESAWIAWNWTCGRSVVPRLGQIRKPHTEAAKAMTQAVG